MRKLAPMFIVTSIVALAGGTAFANTNDTGMTTDKMGSPTVSKNAKNPQGNSYSDKSNTAKGTNAKMDDPAKQAATGSPSSANVAAIDNDDKTRTSNDPLNTKDTAMGTTTPKAKKHKKIASNSGLKTSTNPPVSTTSGAADNSTSGVSGGDGGSSGSAGAGAGSSK